MWTSTVDGGRARRGIYRPIRAPRAHETALSQLRKGLIFSWPRHAQPLAVQARPCAPCPLAPIKCLTRVDAHVPLTRSDLLLAAGLPE